MTPDSQSNRAASRPGPKHEEADATRRFAQLTARERDVVRLIVEGRTTKEISTELRVSPRTIDAYRARIMARMGVRRLAELVRLAVLYLPHASARSDRPS